MILSDRLIREAIARKQIVIEPFREKSLGCNSYDVHLGSSLAFYLDEVLDAKKPPTVKHVDIPDDGYVLYPNKLYLGVTEEYTETNGYVPWLDGKSSVGRLGIFIHCTAGRGDVSFHGYWTLEIVVVEPVRVYKGMPIGQLSYFEVGPVDMPYDQKQHAKYSHQGPLPQESRMWMNFANESKRR